MAGLNDYFFTSIPNAINSMLGSSFTIDYGIIEDVPAKGIVTVATAVAYNAKDIRYVTCILATTASDSFTIDVVPKKGDKVLVFYPKRYDSDMFSTKEIIINPDCQGNNMLSGIAVLCNQFKTADNKNYVQFLDGKMDLRLAYDKDNLFSFTVDSDGSFVLTSNKASISIDKENKIEIKNDKASASIDKEGKIEIKNDNASISIGNDGKVEIKASAGGKVSIKAGEQSLFAVLNSILTNLQSLQTMGNETTQQIAPATVAKLQQDASNLANVLS